ncbi:MAG: outer membrane beta-barrel protein [Marinilabiliaceae bacterium]|nr:outer membrane beta-barrel protein [Marinilabiliaceae bacterium]
MNRKYLKWSFMQRVSMFFIILFCCMFNYSIAQDRIEIGGFLGASYYLGDLNPGTQFKNSHPVFGGIGRYVFSDRVVFRGTALLGQISGSYPQDDVLLVEDEFGDTGFSRRILDVAAMVEYNFMSYDHQFVSNTNFTPYVTFGLANTTYRRYSNDQGFGDNKPVFVLSLPFGLGVKYKLTKWIRVGAEWTFRKTFVDDLDQTNSDMLIDPTDPYGFNEQGSIHNNDWYSFAGVYVTFNLFRRKTTCNSGF